MAYFALPLWIRHWLEMLLRKGTLLYFLAMFVLLMDLFPN